MRIVRKKRLRRTIAMYKRRYKMLVRYSQMRRQKWEFGIAGRNRNTRLRMLVKAYAFQLRRRRK